MRNDKPCQRCHRYNGMMTLHKGKRVCKGCLNMLRGKR